MATTTTTTITSTSVSRSRSSGLLHYSSKRALLLIAPLYLLVFLAITTSTPVRAHDIRFVNSCSEPIWAGTLNNAGFDLLANGGFRLDTAAAQTIQAPVAWQGRFWGRTGCTDNYSNGDDGSSSFTCETGDCGSSTGTSSSFECQGMAGRPPATLVEMTFDADCCGGIDFYDVSLVDGYNLPMSISPVQGTFQLRPGSDAEFDCQTAGCVTDLNEFCPNELRVYNEANQLVACQSACAAFDTDEFCCRGSFGTAELCPPFDYSKIFKASCPRAYSYAYDDQSSLFTCLGTAVGESGYEIEFCPGGNGGNDNAIDCGCPSQCLESVLDRMAADPYSGSHSCRERIQWLMSNPNMNQIDACRQVGIEFPGICDQGCHPDTCNDGSDPVIDCGCPSQCTESVLYRMATDPYSGSHSCRDRIQWLMSNQNMNQNDACRQVGNEFPDICDQGCHPDTCNDDVNSVIDCGCSSQCTARILNRVAKDHANSNSYPTCRDRIQWLISNQNMNQIDACRQVGNEFPGICDQGCHPDTCSSLVVDCGCPTECTGSVLDQMTTDSTGTYSCRERINWSILNRNMNERNACEQVSQEFPSICGQGCSPSQCDTVDNRECPMLIWSDEFDGTSLDATKWEMQVGDGCDQTPSICGWGNNELQSYEQDNVAVAGGLLTIEARRQSLRGKEYTSGRIRTKALADFQYGRLEAKIKIPYGQGMWPAFWMLPTESVYGIWPTSGEIDIMENIGREPSTVHATIHYGPAWPSNQVQGSSIDLLGDDSFHESFHEFAVEWQPNEIRWTMDGYEFLVKRRSDVLPYTWPFEEKFHFILNLAVGGNWPGTPDAFTTFPQQLQVDYVRVYESTFGRLTGPSMVETYAEGVAYTIQDALPDYVYTWSLPTGASIDSSDPSNSNSITVSFGDESGYISVSATSAACNSIVRTFSVPVKVGGRVSDCGCGSQCAESTLDELATGDSGTFSCRDRINWLMSHQDKTELEACALVSDEFPSICGQGCDPETCNEP